MSLVWQVTHPGSNCGARFHIPKNLIKFKCPNCSRRITSHAELTNIIEEPLCPFSPFVGGFSLIVKPTFTTWEKSNRNSFLHIGISDSTGNIVYHFLDDGAHQDNWSGQNIISIPLIPPHPSTWDNMLTSHYSSEVKRQNRTPYHTLNNNCYDFTVRFLNSISYASSSTHTKEEVVEKWVAKPVGEAELLVGWLRNAKAGRLEAFPSFENCGGESFQCDVCGDCFGPQSVRFRCKICPDYDLCAGCFEGNSHEHKKFIVVANV